MSDPWSINYFDPPTPHTPAPTPRVRKPRLLPEVDRLFRVQRDCLKTLRALEELERRLGAEAQKFDRELHSLRFEAENAYRVIRSYLKDFAN